MTDDPRPTPSLLVDPATTLLGYEGRLPAPKRPAWVYVIGIVYLLLLSALFVIPIADRVHAMDAAGWTFFGPWLLSALSLIVVPIRVARGRPTRRGTIWIPIVGSGFLFGLLAFGVALCLCTYWRSTDPDVELHIIVGGAGAWAGWSILFGVIALSTHPQSVAMRLHRWLIAGSVLELLVAVPTHVIVRRRNECCAGLATGVGICLGVAVMFISFGPSVLLLFYRRRKLIAVRRK